MLVGTQFALPGAVAVGVGAGRPETGAAAEKAAVAQDENAAVAARHAVGHPSTAAVSPTNQINDIYGHPTGDDVLVRLSRIISKQIRSIDLLARWGGEESVILAPGLDGPAAHKAAERLKAVIEEAEFDAVASRITCSFGVTELFEGDTAETMVARADNALYRAKKNGRNRVELAAGLAPAGDDAAAA